MNDLIFVNEKKKSLVLPFQICISTKGLVLIQCDMEKLRSKLKIIYCTVEDDSTGGAWIQKMHDFAKSQMQWKFIKSLPQIIWSWAITWGKIKYF